MPYVTQAVVTVPATVTRLTDVATVKEELGVTATTDDTYLGRLIDQASSAISTYCAYTFGIETLQETYRNPNTPGPYYDRVTVSDTLILRKTPVVSVTSLTVDGTGYVLDTNYYIDLTSGILTPLAYGTLSNWSFSNGVIIYTAGYLLPGQSNRNLPYVVERACIDLVKLGYTNRKRDPKLRSEAIMDIVTRTYATTEKETVSGLPVEVAASLDAYRQTIIV